MTTSGPIGRARRIAGAAQALLFLGLPFVRVGGESAVRLDVPEGKLHLLGASFAIDELFVVLALAFVLTAALLLVTVLLGRVWCGWSCPQTVLGDLTSKVTSRKRADRALGLAAVAAVSAAFSAGTLWYFVPPQVFLARLAAGALGPTLGGAWAILGALIFLDLAFLRARFCATACPYAKLQGVLFDRHTLVVAYDARRAADCVDCGACVRVCPTGIDIRHGLQMECIACAACVDACTPIMARLGRPGKLVGYFLGEPGTPRRLVRPATAGLAVALAASVALLAGFVAGRSALGLGAIALDGFAPRRGADGRVVNAYAVSLENRGRAPVEVALALDAGGVAAHLRPDRVALAPGERRTVRVVATAAGVPGEGPVRASLRADAGGAHAEAALSFLVPKPVPKPPEAR